MNNTVCIQVHDAAFGYNNGGSDAVVLQHVNADFYYGEFIALVGENGVGKSTFLRSLAGLQPLLSGVVRINGAEVGQAGLELLARSVAIVLTERVGGFNLKVQDVISSGQMPYTNTFHRLERTHLAVVSKAAEACGVSAYLHKPVSQLSDGMYQKMMIARALAQQTPAILLDEPSAYLDYRSKHELFSLMKRQAGVDNKCIILSTHELELALKYCSRIVVASGNSLHFTSALEARHHPAFLRVSGGFL